MATESGTSVEVVFLRLWDVLYSIDRRADGSLQFLYIIPERELSIDEAMVEFKGRSAPN